MSHKAPLNLALRRPGQRAAVSEAEVARLEATLEARGNGVAGQQPPSIAAVPPAAAAAAATPIVAIPTVAAVAPPVLVAPPPAQSPTLVMPAAAPAPRAAEPAAPPAAEPPARNGQRGLVERHGRLQADGSRVGARTRRRLLVYVPPELGRQLQLHVVQQETTISDVVTEALKRYFGQPG